MLENVESLLIQNIWNDRQICDGRHCHLLESVALLDIQMSRNRREDAFKNFCYYV